MKRLISQIGCNIFKLISCHYLDDIQTVDIDELEKLGQKTFLFSGHLESLLNN